MMRMRTTVPKPIYMQYGLPLAVASETQTSSSGLGDALLADDQTRNIGYFENAPNDGGRLAHTERALLARRERLGA